MNFSILFRLSRAKHVSSNHVYFSKLCCQNYQYFWEFYRVWINKLKHLRKTVFNVSFQSFKSIAKILGTAISDHPNLRMEVMSSLRKIINHSITDSKSNYWHVMALYSETCIDRTPSGLKLLFRIDRNLVKFKKIFNIWTKSNVRVTQDFRLFRVQFRKVSLYIFHNNSQYRHSIHGFFIFTFNELYLISDLFNVKV